MTSLLQDEGINVLRQSLSNGLFFLAAGSFLSHKEFIVRDLVLSVSASRQWNNLVIEKEKDGSESQWRVKETLAIHAGPVFLVVQCLAVHHKTRKQEERNVGRLMTSG